MSAVTSHKGSSVPAIAIPRRHTCISRRCVGRHSRVSSVHEAPTDMEDDVAQAEHKTLPSSCAVAFVLERQVTVGEEIIVVGSGPALGSWDAAQGCRMIWTEGHKWRAKVTLPADEEVTFKFVKVGRGRVEWEAGADRQLLPDALQAGDLLVSASWCKPPVIRTLADVHQDEEAAAELATAEEAAAAEEEEEEAAAAAAAAAAAERLQKMASTPPGFYIAEFAVQKELFLGEYLKLVGNVKELGAWDHRAAPAMTWSESHVWQLSVVLPCDEPVEFKLVRANVALPDSCVWQGGENTIVDPAELGVASQGMLNIGCDWWGNARAHVVPLPAPPAVEQSSDVSLVTPTGEVISASDTETAEEESSVEDWTASVKAAVETPAVPPPSKAEPSDATMAPEPSNFFSNLLANTLRLAIPAKTKPSAASTPPAAALPASAPVITSAVAPVTLGAVEQTAADTAAPIGVPSLEEQTEEVLASAATEVAPTAADTAAAAVPALAPVETPSGYTVEELYADDLELLQAKRAAEAAAVAPEAASALAIAPAETPAPATGDLAAVAEAPIAAAAAVESALSVAVTPVAPAPSDAADTAVPAADAEPVPVATLTAVAPADATVADAVLAPAEPVTASTEVAVPTLDGSAVDPALAAPEAAAAEAATDPVEAPEAEAESELTKLVQSIQWGTGLEEITFTAEQLEELTRQGFASNLLADLEDPVEENTVILRRGRLEVNPEGETVVVRGGNVYNSSTDSVQVVDIDQVADEEEMQALAAEIVSKAANKAEQESLLGKIGKYAGYAAAGVGAATLFGAMAIDVTDLAIIGSVIAAGGAVASAQNSDVRKRGAAGPAYSILLTAADIAKRVSSLTGSDKQSAKSLKSAPVSVSNEVSSVTKAQAATSEAQDAKVETAKTVSADARPVVLAQVLEDMRTQLGTDGLSALEAAAQSTDVSAILQELDGSLGECEKIRALSSMLLRSAGGRLELTADDVHVAAAKQLAEEHCRSKAASSGTQPDEQAALVLAALTLSAVESGKIKLTAAAQ